MRSEPRRQRPLQVELAGIDLKRAGRAILHGIDWRIGAGEHWALIGGNGAGKTQLLKLVAGDVWPDPESAGRRRYRMNGERFDDPYGVRQEITYLGPERQDRYERYGWDHPVAAVIGTGIHRSDIPLDPLSATDTRRIASLLRRLDIAHLAARRFLSLSYGERRLVLFARALAWRPRLLLLDEPTNGLDDAHRGALLHYLEHDTAGLGWVFSSHREEDLPANTQRLLVLQAGRVRFNGKLDAAALRRAFRFGAAGRLPRRQVAKPRARRSGTPLLSLRNASIYVDAERDAATVADVTLDIDRGACWVIHGGNGAGKSTLLRALYGDLGVATGGSLWRRDLAPGEPMELFKRRVGFIAPHLQTDQPQELSVLQAVISGLHASIGLNAAPTLAEQRRARASLRRFGLERFARRELRELSYGQLRRVLFARAGINEPRLLLLDEPFAGIDTPTRVSLLRAIEALIEGGLTVVMASHHRSEWPRATTHELELAAGRVVYCGLLRT
jgi:molybdate transport system ATP-binding protein